MSASTDQTISMCRGAQWIEVEGRLWASGEDYDRQWEEVQRLARVLELQKAGGLRWQHIDDAREREVLRARVADLSMLVRRLAFLAPPDKRGEALDYLKRHQLEGSPLRDDPSAGTSQEG